MQYVAFFELALGSIENLAAGNRRVNREQSQNILQLIAEAKRSAGLVESGASPNAAGKGLVKHPTVEDQISSRFGGMYLHSVKQLVPEHLSTFIGCTYIARIMVLFG